MPYVDGPPDLPPAVPLDGGAGESGPPGMLLRSAAPDARGPAAVAMRPPRSPDVALALDADQLLRLVSLRAGRPARWRTPPFAREVELVRSHLRPIRLRPLLAASFGREAFHGQAAPGSDGALAASAVRVAYALRWLELGDGVTRGPWRTLLG